MIVEFGVTEMNEQDVVARLYDELIEALREKEDGASSDHWRVTVAEIYQDLVPYRRARASLGVEMNADYEHALLRLLAGEGDRVRLEPVEARGELESTLQTSNPDVTLYRKFAACDVQISAPDSFEGAPEGGGPVEERADAAAERGPSSESSGEPDRSELRIGPPPGRATEPASAAESGDGPRAVQEPGTGRFGPTATCPECERGLPAGRTVLFCPFCGSEQPRVCAECGTSLEPEWSFCVACGEPAGTVPPGG